MKPLKSPEILKSDIWNWSFSTNDSELGQTSSRTNNSGLPSTFFNRSPNLLTPSSSLWNSGTGYPQCSYILSTIVFNVCIFEKVTNIMFSMNLPSKKPKTVCQTKKKLCLFWNFCDSFEHTANPNMHERAKEDLSLTLNLFIPTQKEHLKGGQASLNLCSKFNTLTCSSQQSFVAKVVFPNPPMLCS